MKTAPIILRTFLVSLVLVLAALNGSAWALTASNSQIINQAQLSYNDGSGTRTVNSAPVVVTVSLIPGTPAVVKGADQTTPYAGPDTPLTNTFTITASNTNGPDFYSLTPAITAATNASGASLTLSSPVSPVRLGATVTLSGTTAGVLVVPSDGLNDGAVNGIAQNAWVAVNGEVRQVAAIADNAGGSSTITLAVALTANPGVGVLVGEQKTVTVVVKSGTIVTAGQNVVITKQLTVASTSDPTKTSTAGPITDTYTSGLATLTKYVRNVTTPAAGSGVKLTYNLIDFYPSGITAKPGDTLEYLLVAANSGSGPASTSTITDSLPTGFVILKASVYASNTRDITYDNNGSVTYLTSAAGDDQATYTVPTLTVNVGTGATSASGGSIAAGATVRVLYQVSVNP